MRTAIVALVVALAASSAFAQERQDPPAVPQNSGAPQQEGPLVLEPVRNPFVVAPEYSVTQVDGRTGQLAGAYVGKLLDEQLLIGGALYTLTNLGRATDLTYGGLLVGWMTAPAHRVRFGARSLVGFGEGEIPVTIQGYPGPLYYSPAGDPSRDVVRFGGGRLPQPVPLPPTSVTVRVRDSFAVLEPEGSISARVTSHIAVEFAAGYRVTGFSDALRDRLNGVTGALALQLGW
jgi:hypothetical protein